MPPQDNTCTIRIYKPDRDKLLAQLYQRLAQTQERITLADVVAALLKTEK